MNIPTDCPHCGQGSINIEVHPPSHYYSFDETEREWVYFQTDDEPTARVYCDLCEDLGRDAELCARILTALPAPTWEPSRL